MVLLMDFGELGSESGRSYCRKPAYQMSRYGFDT